MQMLLCTRNKESPLFVIILSPNKRTKEQEKMWHTLPTVQEEENTWPQLLQQQPDKRVFDENMSFYRQLGPRDDKLKSNVDLLARLMADKHWGAEASTTLGDQSILAEYERVFEIKLSTEQKRSARNMYMYIARLMTVDEIRQVLDALRGGVLSASTFFAGGGEGGGRDVPLDRAGQVSYASHASRGGGPLTQDALFQGGVRRIPTTTKDRSKAASYDGRGLDPSRHWGTELEFNGRGELMACCGTPAYGKGSIPGCWIQIDKNKAIGLIVPYAILDQVDAWQELSENALLPNDNLKNLFLADVTTGTAFLNKDHYVALDGQIRRRWASVAPRLVEYYERYISALDAAIQDEKRKPYDPCVLFEIQESDPLFWEQVAAMGKLIYQYNKPQQQDDMYLDTARFLNQHLFKVPSALQHFNEVTRGFVVIGGRKLVLLRAGSFDALLLQEWRRFLATGSFAAADKTAIEDGLGILQRIIINHQRYSNAHDNVMSVVDELGPRGSEVHNAYHNYESTKGQLVAALNATVKSIARQVPEVDLRPLAAAGAEAENAMVRLEASIGAIRLTEIEVATAKKQVRNGQVSLASSSTIPAWTTLQTTKAAVRRVIAEKRAAIRAVQQRGGADLSAADAQQLGALSAAIDKLEASVAPLILEAEQTQLLLQALLNKPAGLAQASADAASSLVPRLERQLQAAQSLSLDAVLDQVVLQVDKRRADRVADEERRRVERERLKAEEERQRKELEARRAEEVRKRREEEERRRAEEAAKTAVERAEEERIRRATEAIADTRRAQFPQLVDWIALDVEAFFANSRVGTEEGLRNATSRGLDGSNKLLQTPPLEQAEETILVDNRILTLTGKMPGQLQSEITTLPNVDPLGYGNVYIGDALTTSQKEIIKTTWTRFVDWLFYRNTSEDQNKWQSFTATLAAYDKVVPPHVLSVTRKAGTPIRLRNHSDDLDKITLPEDENMFYRGRIGWKGSSCWIDSSFTSLFSYPRSAISKEILTATQGNHFVREVHFSTGPSRIISPCPDSQMQQLHEAIVQDILQMQDAAPQKNVCTLLAREKWSKCVLGEPEKVGRYYEAEKVFDSLKVIYNLESLQISAIQKPQAGNFDVVIPDAASNRVMVHALYTLYATTGDYPHPRVNAIELENNDFVLSAIVAGSGGHFVTYLKDFYDGMWYYIDVTPTEGALPEVRSIGPDLPANVHHFQTVGSVPAPAYKPCIYVYSRKSMLIELLNLKADSPQKNDAIRALGGVVAPPPPPAVNPYEAFLKALQTENAAELSRLMQDAATDPAVWKNMDDVFRLLDLVETGAPSQSRFSLGELAEALSFQNDVRATEILAAEPPIQFRTEIGKALGELNLLQ